MKINGTPRNPLQAALASISVATHRNGDGRSGIVLAFRALGEALSSVVARSDRTLHPRGPVSDSFARSQRSNVEEIDRLSGVMTQAPRSEVPGIVRDVRAQVVRACRSQVRKIRISRASRGDRPGGES